MCDALAKRIIGVLAERGQRLAVVESCTGGQLAAALTTVPGASETFEGGLVAYANAVKATMLGVDWATLDTYGAVSPEAAREMAQNGQLCFRSDYCVATTGIAGPGGGTPDKPVGLVHLAWAGPEGTHTEEHRFAGERAEVQRRAVERALKVLADQLG